LTSEFHYFDTGYQGPSNPYFGCIVGRVANRIGKGTFILEGEQYSVTLNRGTYHLHGGKKGFDKVSLTAS
jgi:aldose 1-epimerase